VDSTQQTLNPRVIPRERCNRALALTEKALSFSEPAGVSTSECDGYHEGATHCLTSEVS
jgi:hypothetical protein